MTEWIISLCRLTLVYEDINICGGCTAHSFDLQRSERIDPSVVPEILIKPVVGTKRKLMFINIFVCYKHLLNSIITRQLKSLYFREGNYCVQFG